MRVCCVFSCFSCGLEPGRLLCPWDFPGKNTEVGCHSLLQGIFRTQGLNLHPLHWQVRALPLVSAPRALMGPLHCQGQASSLRAEC